MRLIAVQPHQFVSNELSMFSDNLRVWGLSPPELHDRFWAARRVAVVRLGQAHAVANGAELYLLLPEDVLVAFDLGPLVRALRWLKPDGLRLRLSRSDDREYAEFVESDSEGRLVAMRRQYRATELPTVRAWLTQSRDIAEAWRQCTTVGEGASRLRRGQRRRRDFVPMVVRSELFRVSLPAEANSFVRYLVRHWERPDTCIDGIYMYKPGVWVHERTQIDPGSRLVGSLWLGGGVRVDHEEVVVGPQVVPDRETRIIGQSPVDWKRIEWSRWKFTRRMSLGRRFSKRVFDIAFSAGVLIGTSWLWPLIILAIAIEDGWPPFFAHTRQTLGGRDFPCYKFRTMRKDAEAIKARLQAQNQADGPQFFIDKDPRLTRVGAVLRKFQLDEIPQFWNVLLGHMSVVGPRPSPDKENQYCPAWREARLSVRPGLTGLWQVRRTRAPMTDFQEWIRYDLEYVQRQSWRLDIAIICATFKKVLGR